MRAGLLLPALPARTAPHVPGLCRTGCRLAPTLRLLG